MRRFVLFIGFVGAVFALLQIKQEEASATGVTISAPQTEVERLRQALDSTAAELDITRNTLQRAERILELGTRYSVNARLATSIYDVALAEGLDPDLAFRVVRLESEFNPRAVSPVGALGLTQLMLPTARHFEPNVTREQLFEPKRNLRIGFRYLRALIREYDNDVTLALLVYNRGPVAVNAALARGESPANGYERIVLKGYEGPGVVN
ncbi:MAG TPA: transglycosylase SLT domain-containing protein [Gemmatimonadaceae bacterium]|nr:transglycosylase SLT domain-containing protein [Gemmatimonadaceae bacterium]